MKTTDVNVQLGATESNINIAITSDIGDITITVTPDIGKSETIGILEDHLGDFIDGLILFRRKNRIV